ncbi:hypothetical protein MRX96_000795 [Rhipicephalus microplus]
MSVLPWVPKRSSPQHVTALLAWTSCPLCRHPASRRGTPGATVKLTASVPEAWPPVKNSCTPSASFLCKQGRHKAGGRLSGSTKDHGRHLYLPALLPHQQRFCGR